MIFVLMVGFITLSNRGIVKFTKNKNDFGKAYDSYYYSKAFDLGAPEREKNVYGTIPELSGRRQC